MNKKFIAVSAVIALLEGCSSVGPGFANHPADCALGIPWADCLPGTKGYANGGGSLHRKEAAEAAKAQHDAIAAQFEAVRKQCEADMAAPELNPLRNKIEFARRFDEPPPFQYASLDSFPTASERLLIAKWAKLRDACIAREHAVNLVPPNATPLDESFIRQEVSFSAEAEAKVSELVVALYQQKLTYGEFAQRRYAISTAAASAARQYREARLLQDQDRQLQAQQLANQQFANSLNEWANYMQALNARQPQTVHLTSAPVHCTTMSLGGGMASTNCN
ncbi:TPA: hypothetical protein QDA96_002036 [Burkholderia vietnamiensis]|uniref:hypothetical protein n=1 Tax=Burkholderia vietnamiensis TaxID=60552 RepID=UPI000757367E|nr:hypothetical protein [Burkholderia vietnamiensis]KVS25677.1 hypothetical protein WK34_14740 [Burkholderia vietnamiensis]MBR8016509.1 hypothetical protein [Burkholderia vietnamiensis]CAG9190233.1 conserved hypothetical protein [Burkholderia vietnamiensis]HDR8919211.1 hypothetical protein [Burkholderia vietnamiensis]HDR8977323.1 hypothetical protein [Burkholderia vietnamiensis]